MAIGWIYLAKLNELGVFRPRSRVLDVGCQHIFDIPADEGEQFLLRHGDAPDPAALRDAVHELSRNCVYPNWNVYVREFLALSSIDYTAYDIFPGDRIHVLDLNFDPAPEEHWGAFDVVLNFGTTEHVFNQLNSFKVIHDTAKVGGFIFHQVPTVGYLNHGYWTYSIKTFVDLAAANEYEVVSMWITGPQGSAQLDDPRHSMGASWGPGLPENNIESWRDAPAPNGLINVLLRKTADAGFRLPLDSSSSARAAEVTATQVRSNYG